MWSVAVCGARTARAHPYAAILPAGTVLVVFAAQGDRLTATYAAELVCLAGIIVVAEACILAPVQSLSFVMALTWSAACKPLEWGLLAGWVLVGSALTLMALQHLFGEDSLWSVLDAASPRADPPT